MSTPVSAALILSIPLYFRVEVVSRCRLLKVADGEHSRTSALAFRSSLHTVPEKYVLSRVCTRCEIIPSKEAFSRGFVIYYEISQSILRLIYSQASLIALDRLRVVSIPS